MSPRARTFLLSVAAYAVGCHLVVGADDFMLGPMGTAMGGSSTGGSGGSGGSGGTAPAGWADADWLHRKPITIHASQVAAPQAGFVADFPVLVATIDDDIRTAARADGQDIFFTGSNGVSKLAHELQSYSASAGQLIAWVAVPTLSAGADTLLYVYYGNPNADDQADPSAVWDAGFRGVWHLEQDPGPGGAGDITDSTGYANHATAASTMASDDSIAAQIGRGIDLDGTDDFLASLQVSGIDGNSPFTMEAWVFPRDGNQEGTYGSGLIAWGPPGTANHAAFLYYNSGEQTFEVGFWANDAETGPNYPSQDWYHVAHTYDGTTQHVHVNGAVALTRQPGSLSIDDTVVNIGLDSFGQSRYLGGIIDEVRISSTARSSEWIQTCFANQSSPETFASFGDEQNAP